MTSSTLLLQGLAFAVLLSAASAQAQQAPVTGRMLGPTATTPAAQTAPAPQRVRAPAAVPVPVPAPAAVEVYAVADHATPADTPAAYTAPAPTHEPAYVPATTYQAAPPPRTEPGDVTRQLLRLQASGTQSARGLPMLGDQAHASYARYLKSFEHELPEFFENTVGSSSKGGGN